MMGRWYKDTEYRAGENPALYLHLQTELLK